MTTSRYARLLSLVLVLLLTGCVAQRFEAFEIWGQLLDGSSPVFLEANFRISFMGIADNDPAYDGVDPDGLLV